MTPAKEKPSEVKVQPAKGRPMLTWVGKRPITRLQVYPAQHIETFDPDGRVGTTNTSNWKQWPPDYPKAGLLFHGDNKEVLAHLLANGFRNKVRLIYIDPPFDSGADYVRRVQLRGQKTGQLDGEGYSIGEQIQYTDLWANDTYLQFMYERLLLLRELLTEDGSILLHCDYHKSHHLRMLLDEVMGADNFESEIVWQRTDAHNDANGIGKIHDLILQYVKGESSPFNPSYTPLSAKTADQWYRHVEEGTGRRYNMADLTARGLRRGKTGEAWRGIDPGAKGNHWRYTPDRLEQLDKEGRIVSSESGIPYLKRYLDESKGTTLQDIWTDISMVRGFGTEGLGYPTQKPEALLRRIVSSFSDPGDIVLDAFIGSGTTAIAAQHLGRRWIGCDINRGAIQTTAKRLQGVINDQFGDQRLLRGDADDPKPAQLGFAVWRVNDYDLQIQHNEAVNLACDLIGVTRLRSDAYFDGTLGKSLVKVISFNHPLTPLDLEELKRELDARPDEDRSLTLVCLGIELAAQAWIDDWNKMRRSKTAVNRMDVIELRADPKYGGVIRHDPASAQVTVRRASGRIHVEIEEFISPTIVQRLNQQAGPLRPQVDDWRAMVDSIAIDTSYDGSVFNIDSVDVPERKSDLVKGEYDIEAPKGKRTTVAIKIIDMLGEEVLITQEV